MSLWTALSGMAAAVWLIIAGLPWQPHRTRERIAATDRLTEAPTTEGPKDVPSDLSAVTVLVPARNEAAHLGATLTALRQQGANLHAIVIDDRSEDGTAAIAAAFQQDAQSPSSSLSVEVVNGAPLPAEWGGKLWALQQGLERAERPYCLLLDADIVLAPNLIPALLTAARRHSAALVSVMATLRCETSWERLLVPPFIFFFKLLYPFALVARARSRVAAAAGGCILVETAVLREIGAFSAWKEALIDDCTLARRVKGSSSMDGGRQLRLYLSHDVVSVRAYRRLSEFWQMVVRTAFTQLSYSLVLLLLTTLIMLVVFAAPFVSLLLAQSKLGVALGAIALAAMFADFRPVAHFYQLPLVWRLTLPAAAVLFLAMTWHSAINYYCGTRATWKARSYGRNV
jgi:hopene-associated glycosyltransferase HpnB